MVYFDIILCMDWLSPYHSILDFVLKILTLAMLCIHLILWKRSISHKPIWDFSYISERRLILWSFECNLTYISDVHVESSSLDSFSIVSKFSNIFPTNLCGLPPECDIVFVIDLEPADEPICKES